MACSRPRFILAVALLAACSAGDNDDDTGNLSISTGATVSASTGTPTTDPSTGAPTGTSTTGDGTSTTGEPGTTVVPTTGEPDTSSTSSTSATPGDETGPICDPGMPNCVCDNGACIDGYVCQNDVCGVGLECPDDVEPPADAEATAKDLGDITDNNDDFFEQGGVLSGSSDVDWYTWHGADTLGYVAEPTFTLVTGDQRNCMFFECDDGGVAQTKVDCPVGTDFAISPMLRPGCCGAASFLIGDLNCPGNDESATMWLRVDKSVADSCSIYAVKLNF